MNTDDRVLNDAQIRSILGSVQNEHLINPATVELAANFYLDSRTRAAQSAGRGLKTDLQQISAQCRQLAKTLDGMPMPAALVITALRTILGPKQADGEQRNLQVVATELRHIADAIEKFTKRSKGRLVGFDPTMELTLSILEIAYRYGTGKQATHSSHVDGQHTGVPRSEFGRFVGAFFAKVDPVITPMSLTTEVRKFVANFDHELFQSTDNES